jgi:hypothetical protein
LRGILFQDISKSLILFSPFFNLACVIFKLKQNQGFPSGFCRKFPGRSPFKNVKERSKLMQKHILEEPVASTVISHRFSHVVWGAVIAGAFLTTLTQFGLTLLGTSIGLSSLNITEGNNLPALGMGAAVWWIISGWISFYIGGLVSGRMSGIPRRLDGMLHGLLALSVTVVFSVLFFTTSLGAVIAGSFGIIKTGGQAVASVAPQIAGTAMTFVPQELTGDLLNTRGQMREALSQVQDPAKRKQLSDSLVAISSTDNSDVQKQQAVNMLIQDAGQNPLQARSNVDRWSQNFQMIKQNLQTQARKAAESAQAASNTAGKLALASFIMLAVGAFLAGLGGSIGAPHWSDQEIS